MKSLRVVFACVLLLLLSSCVPILSLHRWYSDADLVVEPGLVGDWYEVDDKGKVDEESTLTFAQDQKDGYTLSVREEKRPELKVTYAIYLFRLNGQLFIDLSEGTSYIGDEELDCGVSKVPAHTVGKISIGAGDVRMEFLDDEWVDKALKSNPNLIRNVMVDEKTILTASETDLQQFLLGAIGSEKAFAVTFNLKRKTAPVRAPAAPAKP